MPGGVGCIKSRAWKCCGRSSFAQAALGSFSLRLHISGLDDCGDCAQSATSTGATQGGVVAAINVSGNQRIEAGTIQSYMVIQPGDPFDADRINESLKTLYATGLFSNVSITRDGEDLDVAVVENPTVDQVFFSGNKVVADKDAGDAISLKSRAVFTEAAAEADRRTLLDLYAKKGYYNASVTPEVIRLPDNRVNVVFQCADGCHEWKQQYGAGKRRALLQYDRRLEYCERFHRALL